MKQKKLKMYISIVLFNLALSNTVLSESEQTRQLDCLFATQIDRLTTRITEPGAYCLIEDVIVSQGRLTGIIIDSDNVFLDLNGHTFFGIGNGTTGISVINTHLNVTIRNGSMVNMRLNGIFVANARDLLIEDILFFNNSTGFLATGINQSVLRNCAALQSLVNGFAFNIGINFTSQNVTLFNCVSQQSGLHGFFFNNCLNFNMEKLIANNNAANGFNQINGNQNDYLNCIANNNNNIGFLITGNANSVHECEAKNNISNGFQIGGPNNCVINNLAKINGNIGFFLDATSAQAQIRDNTATGNAFGFQNNGNANNRFYTNFANNNSAIVANNFIGIPNVFVSPVPADPINFTTNISN